MRIKVKRKMNHLSMRREKKTKTQKRVKMLKKEQTKRKKLGEAQDLRRKSRGGKTMDYSKRDTIKKRKRRKPYLLLRETKGKTELKKVTGESSKNQERKRRDPGMLELHLAHWLILIGIECLA